MSRTLFLIDIPNLFTGTRNVWPDCNLDYEKVIKMYEDVGHKILAKVAYCSPGKPRSSMFFSSLRDKGFVFDDMNQAAMAIKIVESIKFFDSLIIGTSDPFIIPLLTYARHKGVSTHVFGVNVHGHISRNAEVYEVDEYCLKNRNERPTAAQQVDMPADIVSSTDRGDG